MPLFSLHFISTHTKLFMLFHFYFLSLSTNQTMEDMWSHAASTKQTILFVYKKKIGRYKFLTIFFCFHRRPLRCPTITPVVAALSMPPQTDTPPFGAPH